MAQYGRNEVPLKTRATANELQRRQLQIKRDMEISRTPITVCTRCGHTIAQSRKGVRCGYDELGLHSWWTGTPAEWFRRQR